MSAAAMAQQKAARWEATTAGLSAELQAEPMAEQSEPQMVATLAEWMADVKAARTVADWA